MVLEALRITDNNQENACEWLLGDRSHDNAIDALEDGIEPSSPLYQSIITNPVVQLGLSNPRCLLGECYRYHDNEWVILIRTSQQ